MARSKFQKVKVNKECFLLILKQKNCSIRKLGKENENYNEKILRTERQIRRCLNDEEMPFEVLDGIAQYLNVDPEFLSGVFHEQVNKLHDENIKEVLFGQLTPEKHPYPYGSYRTKYYPAFFNTIIDYYNISEQFKNLSNSDKKSFRNDIHSAILNAINNVVKKDDNGNDFIPQNNDKEYYEGYGREFFIIDQLEEVNSN